MSDIIFYAPVGNLIKGFKNGGAEAGCRKTMQVLTKGGHTILLMEKPARKSKSKSDGILLAVNLIKLWVRLVLTFRKNKNAIFHIAGFYLNQIYFEWLLSKTAKAFNIKVIYEIRNGGMIESYYDKGNLYRYFFKSTMVNSSLILCQGFDYIKFLREQFDKDSIYYPNYIMDSFIGSNDTGREQSISIRLIYFGRVVSDKNIEFIVEVCKELKLLNVPLKLDIIGSYEDDYHKFLMDKIQNYDLLELVLFHGRKEFNDIYEYLKMAHFFIFPSREKREGHSNSLTEAMGCGVVPIVSLAGFNASIVGNPELVMEEFNALLYAKTIANIWTTGTWKQFSDEVYKRVLNNYTESIVKEALLKAYELV